MKTFVLIFTVLTASASSLQWPVFFERLGQVHSVHNKWDLALRVHINLPALEAKVGKIQSRLDLLDKDFRDPDVVQAQHRSSEPSRLDDLKRSWNEQNRHLRLRCGNLQRRSKDLRELGMAPEPSGNRQSKEMDLEDLEKDLYAYEYQNHAPLKKLSRKKRQQGVLKSLFGVAYDVDVSSMEKKIKGLDTKLQNKVTEVNQKTNNLKSATNEMIGRQKAELRMVEGMTDKLERKVGRDYSLYNITSQ